MTTIRTKHGTYQASFTHFNKRFRKTFKSKLEADKYEFDVRHLGVDVDENNIPTLEDVSWEVFDEKWANTPNEVGRRAHIRCFTGFFGHRFKINELDNSQCKKYVGWLKNTKRNSQSTINGKISALTVVLDHAEENGYITSVPKLRGRKKPNNQCLEYISEEEEAIIVPFMLNHHLKSMNDFGEFWCWSVDTGFRPSESRRLTKADVYLDDSGRHVARLRKSKTNTWRVIPLTNRALAMWNKQAHRETPWGHIGTTQIANCWERVRAYRGRTGDPSYKAYLTRHTTGSRLVQRGTDLPVIKEILGHTDLTSTQRYAKVSPTNLFNAIDKLNNK
tara:strand:- start:16840 stop:17838 length:999 start_codon:yes stop_codon:yes gene_type:complete